jgi:hypothetical protein
VNPTTMPPKRLRHGLAFSLKPLEYEKPFDNRPIDGVLVKGVCLCVACICMLLFVSLYILPFSFFNTFSAMWGIATGTAMGL